MKSRHALILITFLVLLDALTINCLFAVIYFLRLLKFTYPSGGFNLLILINICYMISALIARLYTFSNVQNSDTRYKKIILAFFFQIVIFIVVSKLFSFKFSVTEPLFYFFALELLLLISIRLFVDIADRYFLKMDLHKRKIAIIGDDALGNRLEKFFLQNRLSISFAGSFRDLNEVELVDEQPVDKLHSSIKYAIEHELDEVYSTVFPSQSRALDQVLKLAEQHCVRIRFVTSYLQYQRDLEAFSKANYKLSRYYDGIPILVNRMEPLTKLRNRILKRGFDIIFSLLVIVFLLSWLFPLIVILILLESKGNPIFKQLRSGKDNESFYCFKFRSMRLNEDSNTRQASKDDPRVTKIGSFIRKTSIDELPQFFNVLFGQMSVVGPRPHMVKHTEQYRYTIDGYMTRHFLKPGITGQAQVNGFRGQTKEESQMLGRVAHDISYMESWSLLKDVKIIFKTITNAVSGEENAF
ncbi:exopolysaccharide biosynthesis polyprenyl glycosylphosphotransferase [Pedobacter sp. MC2016-05]|uniref:exopolysaccharide biosynthesis polyprenyl glycosylphosphotransferase n=1 Tax=Pedobacter sp. MC2016-05 TaxID=2994474 RepID=UPI002247310C|nr:exopolysaccharide biosynthesis polyprenyl glycosylphosphotransferase [Pedobacter sp. MC2016-05]MCX2473253.1 exopolysaccharide biosynthesis polyprenyl glycosylphosphotransferase [Pedobacter sp. MC2016-05]